jgi:hypothetical protein
MRQDGHPNLAGALFASRRQLYNLEDELIDWIAERIPGGSWMDFTYDHYDASLEVTGVADEARFSPDDLESLWALGFDACWLNHRDGWETYYVKGRPVEGYRRDCRARGGTKELGFIDDRFPKHREED